MEYEDQEYDHPVANSFQTPSQMVLNGRYSIKFQIWNNRCRCDCVRTFIILAVPSRGGDKGNGQQLRSVAEIRIIFMCFIHYVVER